MYRYDANGNLIEKVGAEEQVTYAYDSENHLIRVETTRFGATIVVEYVYDAEGNRVRKTIDGTVVINYLVDTNRDYAQVVEERDGNGNLLVRYVYGHDLISQTRGGATSYYHYDGLGSTRALTNSNAAVTDTYVYDAFGNLLDKTGVTPNDHLFTGEFFDSNLGFYYLRARYMNPAIGRFVTMDTFAGRIWQPVSLHKYLYAHANPVNFIDPSGKMTMAETAFAAALLGSLAGWRLYNLTHPGDDWSFRECFVWTGLGGITAGLGFLWLAGPELGPVALEMTSQEVASQDIKLSQIRALRDLGLSEQARRAFFEGKTTLIEIPTVGGKPTIAILRLSSDRLTAGIFSVFDKSGAGVKAFADFRGIARNLARLFEVSELELQGIAVMNPKIEEMLVRLGFTLENIPIPPELGVGGGMVDAYSKVFPVVY